MAKAGFTAEVVDGQTREREKAEKLRTYQSEIKRFWIAVLLTLPLVGQMFFMFGEHGHHNELPRWLQLALATPCSSGLAGAFTTAPGRRCGRRGEHGCAGCAGDQHGLGFRQW